MLIFKNVLLISSRGENGIFKSLFSRDSHKYYRSESRSAIRWGYGEPSYHLTTFLGYLIHSKIKILIKETTMKYYFTTSRITKIRKTANTKSW